jgi:hypothetical protein
VIPLSGKKAVRKRRGLAAWRGGGSLDDFALKRNKLPALAGGALSLTLLLFSCLPGREQAGFPREVSDPPPELSDSPGEPEQEPDGELVLRAYQHSYPDKVSDVAYRDGDWAITVGGEIFYWAGGRLLPPSLLGEAESWDPHIYDYYPSSAPSPEIYSPWYIESLRRQGEAESSGRDRRYRGFQGKLYGGLTRRELETLLERVPFLGRNVTVHRDIVEALARVEASVNRIAAEDREIAAFTASLGEIGGYNWREIRGLRISRRITEDADARLSYHSWGLALDILSREIPSGKAVYWLWERVRNPDWMLIPLENRWAPPEGLIRAFENEGFIWGGKWSLYDNMHFEYRPELHEINRLLAARQGVSRTGDAGLRAGESAGRDLHHVYPGDLKIPRRLPRIGELFR